MEIVETNVCISNQVIIVSSQKKLFLCHELKPDIKPISLESHSSRAIMFTCSCKFSVTWAWLVHPDHLLSAQTGSTNILKIYMYCLSFALFYELIIYDTNNNKYTFWWLKTPHKIHFKNELVLIKVLEWRKNQIYQCKCVHCELKQCEYLLKSG